VLAEESLVVLFGSVNDALLGGSLCTEGGHGRAVLATQNHYIRVRLVQDVAGRQPWGGVAEATHQYRCRPEAYPPQFALLGQVGRRLDVKLR
jgi:hypothetical protein